MYIRAIEKAINYLFQDILSINIKFIIVLLIFLFYIHKLNYIPQTKHSFPRHTN